MSDRPRGFHPAYTLHGGPPAVRHYEVSGTGAIYRGDAVSMVANSRIHACAVASDTPMGVAAAFTESTSESTTIPVYVDLQNTVFECQADSSNLGGSSCIGPEVHYDIIDGGGSTTTGLSGMELDDNASTMDHLVIVDKIDRPGNDWGDANIDLYVMFQVDAWARSSAISST